VKAGILTPVAWYTMWAFWQWRGMRLRQLAPTWAYDPPASDPGAHDADPSGDDDPPPPEVRKSSSRAR
jgi:hypothetical protein